ncbi:hypothetical protein [Actinomadura bangladeshensis]|uniref:HTH cro/C1-type domain-containing protein n=1 Tax=Actinomadura bangladeshensis TaxID=453573 RepID=A0A6L9Q8I8_9ACTN|nr:hypothetical protein [Actinomadura bangladeshensis]NEA21747.1 hypothetical protein [Actinomadura bangladeshensis]
MDDAPFTEDLDLEGANSREELALVLRQLQILADRPSLRDLERWAFKQGRTLAKSTVADMLSGKRLPTRAALLTFVEACGVPADQLAPWKRTWGRIALAEDGRPSPTAELAEARRQAEQEGRTQAADILAEAHSRTQALIRAALNGAVALGEAAHEQHRQAEAACEQARARSKELIEQAERDAAALVESAKDQRREAERLCEQARGYGQELIKQAEKDAAARLQEAEQHAAELISRELSRARQDAKKIVADAVQQARRVSQPSQAAPSLPPPPFPMSTCIGMPLDRRLMYGTEVPSIRAAWDAMLKHEADATGQSASGAG